MAPHHPSPLLRSAEPNPHLRIEGVTKRFGTMSAVDDVSLSVGRGEFFALLGPSGCGKTTLLRMLAGFETPDAGRILIDGVDVTAVPPYRRPVNMMFQSYALFPHMSVAQNIGFGLRQENLPKREIQDRVAAMLDLVQLAGLGDRKPGKLSGGQRQRVALARALAKHPQLLLLDEPLAALDRKLREQTQFELVRIQERVGITFIVVTHDQAEAMTMASRIAVMDAGRFRQIGRPSEVYEMPNSRFVADFIGAVNLLKGVVERVGADGITVRSPEAGMMMVEGHHAIGPADVGSPVTIALRPEKITLASATSQAPPRENSVAGIVRETAYLGDTTLYRIELSSGAILRVSLQNAARTAEPAFARGDEVALSWSRSAALLLTQ